MIDYIDEIEACVASDIADGCEDVIYGYTTVSRMMDIITRLRQAEKDAARYRWLRDDYRHECCVDDLFDGSSASVDNRIDEAMQCSK